MNIYEEFLGIKIIESQFAYREIVKTKTVVIGIPDRRRPNNKKMLYNKKTIRTVKRIPIAIRLDNGTLVAHPDIVKEMEKGIRGWTQNLFSI